MVRPYRQFPITSLSMVTPFYKNIRLLILSVVMILAWGFASFQALSRQEDPELVSRVAIIQTAYPGANAERVEALVTEVIEAELSELEEIKTLDSDSRAGFSSISVTLVDAIKDAQPVWSKVRDEIGAAVTVLPQGTSTPEVIEVDTEAFSMIASLTWQLPSEPNYAILGRYAEELALQVRGVSGTERVELFGEPNEEILVEVDAPTLTAVGLSPTALADRIRTSDAKVTAGQLRSPQQNLAIEVESELQTLEQIRQIPIQTDNGQFTRLSDIAQVSRGIRQPVSDLALTSGKPAVVAGMLMESGSRIDQWGAAVRAVMEDFEAQLPQGVSLDVLFDESRYVENRIAQLLSNLVVGALLVMAVTMVTMGWRAALVVGTALPLTTFAVFGWMTIFEVPIHQMSVTGLIIALGLLIDNAIVAVDEIQMELQAGHPPLEAVTKTVNYLKVPLFASTITTVMAFMPIYLLPGGGGEFVGTIALGVILALITSLAFSLTIIAALAGRLLASTETTAQRLEQGLAPQAGGGFWQRCKRFALKPGSWWADGISSPLMSRPYRWTLEQTMAKPLLAIALTFILPLIGFISVSSLDQQFFPAVSRDQVRVDVEFSASTAIAQTREQMLQARQAILDDPAVEDVHWFVGETAPKFYYNITGKRTNQANFAQALVQLNTDENVSPIIQGLQQQLDQALPAARVLALQLEQGPPFDAPIEYRLYGPNIDELRRLGLEVRQILAGLPNVTYVRDDLSEALPKLGLTLDEEQARLSGLDNQAVAQQLEAYLEGSVGGSILEGTENLPVRVRLGNSDRASLDQIASLDLSSPQGNIAQNNNNAPRSTAALGNFTLVPELASIARRNEQRVNTVQAYLTAGTLPSVVLAKFEQQLAESNFALPTGYRAEFGGEQAEQDSSTGNLALFFPILLMVMIVALVLSLGSFRQAAIVGGVAIGSVGMAMFSLKLFGAVFGFMAIVGTLGLVGIAINDTVVVLSALNESPGARAGDRREMIEVVNKATRHVVTTTITTIAGFVPLLMDGGPFWRPLSIAIAGGISGASLMALYFVPAVYALIYRRKCSDRPIPPTSYPSAPLPTSHPMTP